MTLATQAPAPREGLCGAIGNTPLLRLTKLSKATGSEILAKAEFMNPGGSVKDRTALGIIEDAEERGLLRPGGVIVEGTAGNTGIGLVLVGNAKGYRTKIVIPETQSPEKMELLRALGAELVVVPEKPWPDPGNYNQVAKRLAQEIPGGFWANQFDNPANAQIHYRTTGPEIWEQSQKKITAFVASVGTGGTLKGTARFLKEKNPAITVVCADPMGAAMWSYFTLGHLGVRDGDSFAEGIGQTRVTHNVEGAPVDRAYRIADGPAVAMVYHLLHEEGLFVGLSSGINLCAAVKLAKEAGPGQTIVTILADGGARYLSRLYNRRWLESHKLWPLPKGLSFLEDL
jgi:cysteine synthase A